MGSSPNTALSPSIPLTRRVINNIEEHQRTVLDSYVGGMDRGMNTSPVLSLDEQQVEIKTASTGQQPVDTQAELQDNTFQPESPEIEDTGMEQADPTDVQTQDIEENAAPVEVDTSKQQAQVADTDSQVDKEQQEPDIPEDQTSRASQDDNYRTTIDNDEQDDIIQFDNLVTQSFLSRSVRVPIIKVRAPSIFTIGCLSFTQMLQDYLRAFLPPSHADAYLQIQQMAQQLDVYLSKYPAQYINCMTSDSEFIAFVNHAIQLVLDLTVYPNIWAVLSILLETQDVNTSYMQTMHDYYNRCYDTRMQDYMVLLEKAAEQSKHNMYNNTLDGVSAHVQQSVCNSPVPMSDQHEANVENCTQLPYHAHFNDILTEYPAWSTDANNIENTPIKTSDNRQVLDNLEAYVQDKLSITRSLHDRLGLTENSLLGAQTITVAMVQSDQLTTRIPNYSPNYIEIGQQNDNDYPDDREENLYQVDGTTDLHTPTDHSTDDEDTEPDNNAHKRQRKVHAPVDGNRKELTKQ